MRNLFLLGGWSLWLGESGYSGFDEEYDFNGLMLGGGIGYNWNPVSLEFWINFRDASDYEDFGGGGVDVSVASGGLGLSARF